MGSWILIEKAGIRKDKVGHDQIKKLDMTLWVLHVGPKDGESKSLYDPIRKTPSSLRCQQFEEVRRFELAG